MSLRKLHTWVSVVLIVPFLIVGGTAILIAHHGSLGTGRVHLPRFGATAADAQGLAHRYELRAVAQDDDGALLYATKYGLMRAEPGGTARSADLRADLRDLARLGSGRWLAAAREGLYLRGTDGTWRRLVQEDFKALTVQGDQVLASSEAGVWRIDAAGTPRRAPDFAAPLAAGMAAGEAPPYTLEKLVMDLHTGKAIFGAAREWIWIDALGGAMLILGLSGIVVWRRAAAARARQAEAAARPDPVCGA
ncbi:hypothetical protein C8J30_11318 [Rhodobacter viridis]|uniref:PepSY-associated transmembrane protein n=2 Tax=Rhodobacter viridis TaxID=1054202 RepID=A0A318TTI1_9RHOB|nr:hypothetical protein C8J30_11318 [Rhodobacter viridis]